MAFPLADSVHVDNKTFSLLLSSHFGGVFGRWDPDKQKPFFAFSDLRIRGFPSFFLLYAELGSDLIGAKTLLGFSLRLSSGVFKQRRKLLPFPELRPRRQFVRKGKDARFG